MNRLCWLVGHKWDNGVDAGYDVCERCDVTSGYPCDAVESWHIDKLAYAKWRVRRSWYRLTEWLSPCPYCALRFGRHDPDQCIPF